MLESVVNFVWADAAGNEVLLDSDGSKNSSFVAASGRCASPTAGVIVTPTSDADFAGMCRGFGVDGYDDPAWRQSVSAASTAR